jgi:hypothetical protein
MPPLGDQPLYPRRYSTSIATRRSSNGSFREQVQARLTADFTWCATNGTHISLEVTKTQTDLHERCAPEILDEAFVEELFRDLPIDA